MKKFLVCVLSFIFVLSSVCCFAEEESVDLSARYADPIITEFDEDVVQDGFLGDVIFKYPDDTDYSITGTINDDMDGYGYIFAISNDVHKMYTMTYMTAPESDDILEVFDEYSDVTVGASINSFKGDVTETIFGTFMGMPARMTTYTVTLGGISHYHKSLVFYDNGGLFFVDADYDEDVKDDLEAEFMSMVKSFKFADMETIDLSKYNVVLDADYLAVND